MQTVHRQGNQGIIANMDTPGKADMMKVTTLPGQNHHATVLQLITATKVNFTKSRTLTGNESNWWIVDVGTIHWYLAELLAVACQSLQWRLCEVVAEVKVDAL